MQKIKIYKIMIYILLFICLREENTLAKTKTFIEAETLTYGIEKIHQYKHQSSGLNVVWIENKDENRSFILGVKTPTEDDTGVNHIIEHTLFTGSKKYPSSSLFFDASMQYPTLFMNALTSADSTLFPFCTPYETSYEALFDIYMDSIFNPTMLEQPYTFYEESFYYHPETDRCGGVVYNEMKGANAQKERWLYKGLRQGFYPNTHYTNNSGGSVEAIPTLTYEAFLDTYHKYYYPNNMMLVLYGDLPIQKLLSQIDSYVKDYTLTDQWVDVNVPITKKQEPLELTYPGQEETMTIVKAFLVEQAQTPEESVAFDLWLQTYWADDTSPLKTRLQKMGISEVQMIKDEGTQYPIYGLVATGIIPFEKEKMSMLIDQAWQESLSYKDTEREKEAIKEMQFTQAVDTQHNLRGLDLSESILEQFIHNKTKNYGDYVQKSTYLETLDTLTFNAQNFFKEEVVTQTIYMTPTVEQLPETLKLSLEEQKQWREVTEAMRVWQEENKDTNDTLPQMDAKKMIKNPVFPQLKKEDGITYMLTVMPQDFYQTNLYFSVDAIPQEKLHELFLYTQLLKEAIKVERPFSGKAHVELMSVDHEEGVKHYLHFNLLTHTPEEAVVLFESLRETVATQESDWYEEVIKNNITQFKQSCEKDILGTLKMLNAGAQSGSKRYQYETQYPHYQWIKSIAMSDINETIQKALAIGSQIKFNTKSTIGLMGPRACMADAKNLWADYVEKHKGELQTDTNYTFKKYSPMNKYVQETPVDYVVWTYDKEHDFVDGADYVMAAYVTYDYLQPRIRVEKGAYGSGMYATYPNTLSLYTYRDPDYKSSLQTIGNISQELVEKVTTEDVEGLYVEALSMLQNQLQLLQNPAESTRVNEKMILLGENKQTIRQLQKEILNTSEQDLKEKIQLLGNLLQKGQIGVCTSKKEEKENVQQQPVFSNQMMIK